MVDFVEAYKNKNKLEAARLQTVHSKVAQKPEDNLQKSDTDDYLADHASRLATSRRGVGRDVKSTAKDTRKILSAKTAGSLLKEMDILLDMPLIAAFGAAILKDALDLADFFTVILPMLFSVLCSIFIFMMLLLAGASGKRKMASSFLKKGATIIGGGLIDAIPALSLLPMETITVLVIYLMILYERSQVREMERQEAVAMA